MQVIVNPANGNAYRSSSINSITIQPGYAGDEHIPARDAAVLVMHGNTFDRCECHSEEHAREVRDAMIQAWRDAREAE